MPTDHAKASPWPVLLASLRLGCSSFGGPIAHIGYFERSYVQDHGWLGSEEFAHIVAQCQLLPGPTSSQVGFLVGLHRAGWAGALAAWVGFTLPSAILMFAFALIAPRLHGPMFSSLLHGLKLVAVAVVAHALWSMAQRLCPDLGRAAIALLAAAALILWGNASLQLGVLALSAGAGIFLCKKAALTAPQSAAQAPTAIGAKAAASAMTAFLILLAAMPLAAAHMPHSAVALADIFYRAGSLVFGGGHVVLPLLRDALVPSGWISDAAFLDGYGAAQALPGPLFTVAAYLGAISAPPGPRALWALIALLSIFLPGMLLAVAGRWLWGRAARAPGAAGALAGVNAGVVGMLGAAWYDPVCVASIHGGIDVAIALGGFLLLERRRVPPIVVVILCVVAALLATAVA